MSKGFESRAPATAPNVDYAGSGPEPAQGKALLGQPHVRALIASVSGYAMDGFDLLTSGSC